MSYKNIQNIAKSALAILLKEQATLEDIVLDEIISAELLIKFKKPKRMTDDEYKKKLGAVLKPVADLDNVSFRSKKTGKMVMGKDVLYTKLVSIETTSSGHIVEQQLIQEMAKFLDTLIQENA